MARFIPPDMFPSPLGLFILQILAREPMHGDGSRRG